MKFLTFVILFLPFVALGQIVGDTIYLPADTVYEKTVIEVIEYEDVNHSLSVSLYSGIAFQQLQQQFNDYKYSSQESGFQFKYSIGHIFAKVGFAYTPFAYTDRHSYTNQNVSTYSKIVPDTLTSYTTIINEQNFITYIIRDKSVDISDTTYSDSLVSYTNNYSIIGIPLFVGRNFNFKHTQFALSLGLIPGFILPAHTHNLIEVQEGYFIAESPYLQKFQLSAGIEAELQYRLNDWLGVFFAYSYRASLTNAYSEQTFSLHTSTLVAGLSVKIF